MELGGSGPPALRVGRCLETRSIKEREEVRFIGHGVGQQSFDASLKEPVGAVPQESCGDSLTAMVFVDPEVADVGECCADAPLGPVETFNLDVANNVAISRGRTPCAADADGTANLQVRSRFVHRFAKHEKVGDQDGFRPGRAESMTKEQR